MLNFWLDSAVATAPMLVHPVTNSYTATASQLWNSLNKVAPGALTAMARSSVWCLKPNASAWRTCSTRCWRYIPLWSIRFGRLRLAAWPFAGPAWIREGEEVHLIDHWRHLGTARSEADLHALLDTPMPDFDRDAYRILLKAAGRMVPLAVQPGN